MDLTSSRQLDVMPIHPEPSEARSDSESASRHRWIRRPVRAANPRIPIVSTRMSPSKRPSFLTRSLAARRVANASRWRDAFRSCPTAGLGGGSTWVEAAVPVEPSRPVFWGVGVACVGAGRTGAGDRPEDLDGAGPTRPGLDCSGDVATLGSGSGAGGGESGAGTGSGAGGIATPGVEVTVGAGAGADDAEPGTDASANPVAPHRASNTAMSAALAGLKGELMGVGQLSR